MFCRHSVLWYTSILYYDIQAFCFTICRLSYIWPSIHDWLKIEFLKLNHSWQAPLSLFTLLFTPPISTDVMVWYSIYAPDFSPHPSVTLSPWGEVVKNRTKRPMFYNVGTVWVCYAVHCLGIKKTGFDCFDLVIGILMSFNHIWWLDAHDAEIENVKISL